MLLFIHLSNEYLFAVSDIFTEKYFKTLFSTLSLTRREANAGGIMILTMTENTQRFMIAVTYQVLTVWQESC